MFKRSNIFDSGLSPMSQKQINDNFCSVFSKLSGGNINYTDMDNDVKNKISTQWITVSTEGNLDANHPIYYKFYVPPNVKEIVSAKLNTRISAYRMDSGVADAIPIDVTANLDINTSYVSVDISDYTNSGGGTTAPVSRWGTTTSSGGVSAPTYSSSVARSGVYYKWKVLSGVLAGYFYPNNGEDGLATQVVHNDTLNSDNSISGTGADMVDMINFQHTHQIPSHTHYFSGTSSSHKHTGTSRFTIPAHKHNLNEGIKESTTTPTGVYLTVNSSKIGNSMSGIDTSQNDLDFSGLVQKGSWNEIKISASSVARATVYGVIEVIIDSNYKG